MEVEKRQDRCGGKNQMKTWKKYSAVRKAVI